MKFRILFALCLLVATATNVCAETSTGPIRSRIKARAARSSPPLVVPVPTAPVTQTPAPKPQVSPSGSASPQGCAGGVCPTPTVRERLRLFR